MIIQSISVYWLGDALSINIARLDSAGNTVPGGAVVNYTVNSIGAPKETTLSTVEGTASVARIGWISAESGHTLIFHGPQFDVEQVLESGTHNIDLELPTERTAMELSTLSVVSLASTVLLLGIISKTFKK